MARIVGPRGRAVGVDADAEALAMAQETAMRAGVRAASGRRRRRDFAILKTLGLVRRQVSSITVWQVSTLAGLALLAGVPLGVAAGHWAWALFARRLGISTIAITPVPLVLLTIPAVIVAANAVAFWPGRTTARLRPAEVLRDGMTSGRTERRVKILVARWDALPPIESSSAEDHKGESTNPRVMLAPPARSASGVVRVAGYGTGPIRRAAARAHNWKIRRDIQRSRPTLTVANIRQGGSGWVRTSHG